MLSVKLFSGTAANVKIGVWHASGLVPKTLIESVTIASPIWKAWNDVTISDHVLAANEQVVVMVAFDSGTQNAFVTMIPEQLMRSWCGYAPYTSFPDANLGTNGQNIDIRYAVRIFVQ